MPEGRLIFNPNAGRYPPAKLANLAAAALRDAGWTVDVLPSQSADHLRKLAADTAAEGFDALFLAGGDGSVGLAAPGLADSDTALGLIPTGTANVLAREMGMPRFKLSDPGAIRRCADLLTQGTTRRINLGQCSRDRRFVLWAGMGVDAQVVSTLERRRHRFSRHFAYFEYALYTARYMRAWPGATVQLEARRSDGTLIQREIHSAWSVVASNIGLYAGGLVRFPLTGRSDVEMKLWLMHGKPGDRFRTLWNLMRGSDVSEEQVLEFPFSKAQLRFDQKTALHLDGDPSGDVGDIDISVAPLALKLLVPSS
jgi:diacylglycerol kinase (ATP)